MLSGLDARSGYISEPAFRASQATANDDAATPGLVLTIGNGQLQVISPEDGSPAALAGIRPGDVTFTIDEEPVYETDLERGRAEAYKLQTMVGRVESGNVGYLRIAGFDGGTQAALAAAVQDLRQKIGSKLVGSILDPRNNPGGGFEAAVTVADAFIDKGDIVVIKGHKPASLKRIAATPGDLAKGLPLVGLITRGRVRRRRAAGQPPGGAAGQQDFWRQLDRTRKSSSQQWSHPFDYRSLHDAHRPRDPGKRS